MPTMGGVLAWTGSALPFRTAPFCGMLVAARPFFLGAGGFVAEVSK